MSKFQVYTPEELTEFLKAHGNIVKERKYKSLFGKEGQNLFLKTKELVYGFKATYKEEFWWDKDTPTVAIVNLIIPPDSLIHFSSLEKKCRANRAIVHSIHTKLKGNKLTKSYSDFTAFKYEELKMVKPKYKFSTDFGLCASGIHFFLDLDSAYNYLG